MGFPYFETPQLQVWLALTDALAEMGGLYFHRGSHLRGALPHHVDPEAENLIGFRVEGEAREAEEEAVPVELKAGEVTWQRNLPRLGWAMAVGGCWGPLGVASGWLMDVNDGLKMHDSGVNHSFQSWAKSTHQTVAVVTKAFLHVSAEYTFTRFALHIIPECSNVLASPCKSHFDPQPRKAARPGKQVIT